MGNCVKRFGEVEKENVGLYVIVHGGSPIMNCLHELGLTGESCLESMLVMEYITSLALRCFHMWLRT